MEKSDPKIFSPAALLDQCFLSFTLLARRRRKILTFLHRFGAISIKKSIILSVKIPKFSPSARSSDTKSPPPIRNPDLIGGALTTGIGLIPTLKFAFFAFPLRHSEFVFAQNQNLELGFHIRVY